MGYTLDQLLDQTGLSRVTGSHLAKEASSAGVPRDLLKLADSCRRAADASADEHDASLAHELAEKTAAVAIIRRTLSEIANIDSGTPQNIEKTASPDIREAVFIAAALEQGHSPESVAEFLEKDAGIFGRLGRGIENMRAAGQTRRAIKASENVGRKLEKAKQRWVNIVEKSRNLSETERAALIQRMKLELNPVTTMEVFKATPGGTKGFKELQAYKDLKAAVPATRTAETGAAAAGRAATSGPRHAVGATIGNAQIGLSKKQLEQIKKPALYLGGGALAHRAISGGGKKPSNKRGVVVVNS